MTGIDKSIIKEALILAAGKGTRLSTHFSKILPKVLQPINDKPIIEYVIDLLEKMEIENIFIIIGYRKELIKDYFKDYNRKFNLFFIEQEKLSGIGDAILLAKEHIKEKYFLTILGDSLLNIENIESLYDLIRIHSPVAVEGTIQDNKDAIKRACEISYSPDYKMQYCIEKPKNPISSYRGVGLYAFHKSIFDYIASTPLSSLRGEREISDTMDLLSKQNQAWAFPIIGYDFNINTKEDIVSAKEYFLNKEQKLSQIHH